MSGEFDVVTRELRTAADRVRQAVSPVACWTMSSAGASAHSFGHNELAEVYVKFCSKLSQVVSAAAGGDEALAGQLEAAAAGYESTDSGVGASYGVFGPGLTTPGWPVGQR